MALTAGEYRLERKLGEGGFGEVYAAVHPVIGKPAAVKILSLQFSTNPAMVSRFIAEARAVNQIRHKNIIDIFAFGQLPDGRQYYVMELLEGKPFDQLLDAKGRLSFGEALPILRGIAKALDAAHAKGLLHRDLKPENVFLADDGDGGFIPKLLDFGLVKLLGSTSEQHKTKTGTPMGTPLYMSPEQCRGLDVDGRTDVYSFGVMVFQVFAGRVPFDRESAMDILLAHLQEAPPALSSVASDIPAALDAPLARMLSKDPGERPRTVGEALDALVAAARASGFDTHGAPNVQVTPDSGRSVAFASGAVDPRSATAAVTVTGIDAEAPKAPRRVALVIGATLVGLLALGGGGYALSRRAPSPAPGVRDMPSAPVVKAPEDVPQPATSIGAGAAEPTRLVPLASGSAQPSVQPSAKPTPKAVPGKPQKPISRDLEDFDTH